MIQLNQKSVDAMYKLGCRTELVNKKTVVFNAQAQKLFNLLDQQETFKSKNDSVQRIFKNDSDFYGKLSDLKLFRQGEIDLKDYLKAKKTLENSDLFRKLKPKLESITPSRKRILSEYDGEWSLDRQWDLKPFSATKKILSQTKVLDIELDFSISCGAIKESIDAYGALAWALVQVIEKTGIQCNVSINFTAEDLNSEGVKSDITIELKKAGQYLSPQILAATLNNTFYRRICFFMLSAISDVTDQIASSGLGTPTRNYNNVEFKNGKLKLYSNVSEGISPEGEKAILKALGAS